jgi:lipopolysaccharide exporter
MSKFLSNVVTLFSATLLGQIIGVIVSPVISRLYSPADFGIFSLFISLSSLIALVACLSYQGAINLTKKDEDAANIVVLCLCLILITSILATTVFSLFSGTLERILNAPGLSRYFFLLPLAIIASSVAYVLGSWVSRRQEFGIIAKGNLYSSITGKASSIGLGVMSPSPFGLIFGTIVNDGTIVIILLRRTLVDFHIFRQVSFKKIKRLAERYKKFPQFSALSVLISNSATQAIPFMLAFSFSPVIVGYYAMTYLIITLPLKLIGNSLSTIFYQKACAEKNRTGSISYIVTSVHTRLVSIGMFICLILMIIGPELFTVILGTKWSTAGAYAQILAPWMFVVFISTPLSSIFSVFEKQGASLGFSVSLLISRIVIILIAGFFGDPVLGMLLLSGVGVIFWGWMNMYLLKTAGVSVRDASQEIIRYLIFGLLVCLPLIIAKYLSRSSVLLLGIAVAGTFVYYSVVVYRDTELKEGLLHLLRTTIHK